MSQEDAIHRRLGSISTIWNVVRDAHQGSPEEICEAQQLLIERYGGAIYRYLRSALRDSHAADDLTQEFALRLVRGDFWRADPGRGRFRDYVKTVLFHLVQQHRKKQHRQQLHTLTSGNLEQPMESELIDLDRTFQQSWRSQLLERAWDTLAETCPVFHTVLRFRSDHPEMPSHEMATPLTHQLDRPITAAGVRQTLHRAREKFADFLLDEVARSLDAPTIEQVEQELLELDLMSYCRPALDRYRGKDG